MKRTYPVEVLWCGNPGGGRKGRRVGNTRRGWQFPPAVRRQLLTDCAGKSVLHLFGGRATFGLRLDIDPITRPDVIGDAWVPPFRQDSFDVVILDPPYLTMERGVARALLQGAAWIARERVIWLHTMWSSGNRGLKPERAWLVRVGENTQVRCLQYFMVFSKAGPVHHFKRGPAMKYNRWLAQPAGLPF